MISMMPELPNDCIYYEKTLTYETPVQIRRSVMSSKILNDMYQLERVRVVNEIKYNSHEQNLVVLRNTIGHLIKCKSDIELAVASLVFARNINSKYYQLVQNILDEVEKVISFSQDVYNNFFNATTTVQQQQLFRDDIIGTICLVYINNICTSFDRLWVNWESWLNISRLVVKFTKYVVVIDVLSKNELVKSAQTL